MRTSQLATNAIFNYGFPRPKKNIEFEKIIRVLKLELWSTTSTTMNSLVFLNKFMIRRPVSSVNLELCPNIRTIRIKSDGQRYTTCTYNIAGESYRIFPLKNSLYSTIFFKTKNRTIKLGIDDSFVYKSLHLPSLTLKLWLQISNISLILIEVLVIRSISMCKSQKGGITC